MSVLRSAIFLLLLLLFRPEEYLFELLPRALEPAILLFQGGDPFIAHGNDLQKFRIALLQPSYETHGFIELFLQFYDLVPILGCKSCHPSKTREKQKKYRNGLLFLGSSSANS